ncbi:MAG: type II CAAX prenyl endopeptidase Rce1 family protein [Terracidiphilus sp.]
MEPELPHRLEAMPSAEEQLPAPPAGTSSTLQAESPIAPVHSPGSDSGLLWIFAGPNGLRAGWSVLIFFVAMGLFTAAALFSFFRLHLLAPDRHFTPEESIYGELVTLFGIVCGAAVVALIERRNILDFNLRGTHRSLNFLSGLVAGFAALSVLVGALAAGGWLSFGPVALSGASILRFGLLWGLAFVLVGFAEEGMFRCYLQFTFTRGMNFWWALGVVASICAFQFAKHDGNCAWGVYVLAALGLLPCFVLHRRAAARSAFWQAAWAGSTVFGFLHTGNGGENWIGIFGAGFIGFVFCVSVRLTGSAWWAIGCHASWDWAETFFFGTANSGFRGQGHYLTANAAGNPFWSGGTDGPEGSLLVVGVLLLLLLFLIVVYRRGPGAASRPSSSQPAAG